MKSIPQLFETTSVLVVGDAMLDSYWLGSTSRISPEAPVPVVDIDTTYNRPGGAANVAMNIAALGSKSTLVALIGKDSSSHVLRDILGITNISCNFITAGHTTDTKLRVMSRDQQLIRLDFGERNLVDSNLVYDQTLKSIKSADIVVLSDYGRGTLDEVESIIRLAKVSDLPVLVDPKGTNFSRYHGATIITPNFSEFEAVVGRCSTEDEIVSRGMQLIYNHDLSAVLLTRSEKGMTLLQRGKIPLHLPSDAQEVHDVTGAGDTVISILAVAMASRLSIETACSLAGKAAGIVVSKIGTATVSQKELMSKLVPCSDRNFGILGCEKLISEIELARKHNEKIVMTNGVFDIIHAGHISYLSEARKLGDRLVVAVNSDASVARIKGPHRPINPLSHRMEVLSALECVDWVTSFEESTPTKLITKILPDLLVKGGDYKEKDIAGEKEVVDNGGEVRLMQFLDSISTTGIINTILGR